MKLVLSMVVVFLISCSGGSERGAEKRLHGATEKTENTSKFKNPLKFSILTIYKILEDAKENSRSYRSLNIEATEVALISRAFLESVKWNVPNLKDFNAKDNLSQIVDCYFTNSKLVKEIGDKELQCLRQAEATR